jgi:hypothetical protein
MEQLAVEQLPAEFLGKASGDLATPGTVLARNGNRLHPNGSENKRAPPGNVAPGGA